MRGAKQSEDQQAHGLEVPLKADSVDWPIVQYGGEMTAIHFITDDGRWGRITFDRLDSIKVSRGEYGPYPSPPDEEYSFHWVTTISNSVWLRERYEYEKEHYGSAYNFGGNVDEMLTEFSHYVLRFHDQFVEVLAAGIWFESDDEMLGERDLEPGHPLLGLGNEASVEQFEHAGITCHVRRNPATLEQLEAGARLCAQTVLEVGAELEDRIGSDWRLTHHVRDGVGKSYLRNYFDNPVETFDEVPDLATLRPTLDRWLEGIRERRREMGKD